MVTNVNKHISKESARYGNTRTVPIAEARFLKRKVSPEERPAQQHQRWVQGPFLYKMDSRLEGYGCLVKLCPQPLLREVQTKGRGTGLRAGSVGAGRMSTSAAPGVYELTDV